MAVQGEDLFPAGSKVTSYPEYSVWEGMIQRCHNPRSKYYSYYGGSGVEVDPSWRGKGGFKVFLQDVGRRPENTTLDRIDSSGNYCKDNCRWATQDVQSANKRRRSNNTSGYKGVSWNPMTQSWRVRLTTKGCCREIGSFKILEEAVTAYKNAVTLTFNSQVEVKQ